MNLDPYRDLRKILNRVEKPARYSGGEYGTIIKEGEELLHVAISYPDLYEIGMSNLSVRLLYRLLNSLDCVYCERVFAPALDFEAQLRAHGLPLYSLETGRSLRDFDIIGFSVGYELNLTNLLNILDVGGVSLFCRDRGPDEPIIIAGGPAVTNPVPIGGFLDAVFIGESEGWIERIFRELSALKRRGADRRDLLEYLLSDPSVWAASEAHTAVRAVWGGFGGSGPHASSAAGRPEAARPDRQPPFPVPNLKTVQDHGVVEVMRGCANGCRFCHAGIFYRPLRLKQPAEILSEAEEMVFGCGYREITLSSLSSGDYPGIADLVGALNCRFAPFKVSFSLPSLRINSLTLDLFSGLSAVRKSGLTFAVETPLEEWQRGINKPAPLDRTIEILKEACTRGWKAAKFYFMVGLPVTGGRDETGPIIDFLTRARRETGMKLNVNLACFIPKPHTPFQWAPQLSERAALDKIMTVKRGLAGKGFKLRYHSPLLSFLEGMISRGDERAGKLVYRAFKAGARLDAWEEHFQWDLWRKILAEADWDVKKETCRERDTAEKLPWAGVNLGVSQSFLKSEYERAQSGELTGACCADCTHPCGVCGKDRGVKDRITAPDPGAWQAEPAPCPTAVQRVLFSFTKLGRSIFLGHLNVMQIFERALLRAGYSARFTEGFNPKPRLEFAHPLSLGIGSMAEIAAAALKDFDSERAFCRAMNRALPEGLKITAAKALEAHQAGKKKRSLMSLYWGSDFLIQDSDEGGRINILHQALRGADAGAAKGVHSFSSGPEGLRIRYRQSEKGAGNILRLLARLGLEEALKNGLAVTRLGILAGSEEGGPVSYFELDY